MKGAIATHGAEGRAEPACEVRSLAGLMGVLMAACDERELIVDATGTQHGFRVLCGHGWVEILLAARKDYPATDADADIADAVERAEASSRRPMSDQFPAGYHAAVLTLELDRAG